MTGKIQRSQTARHQRLVERFLDKGSVEVDSGTEKLGIRGISDYEELAHTIRELQQEVES
jgi:hypothetical protein